MNNILNKVTENRNGHYCHVLEVSDLYELKSCLESLHDEFIRDYSLSEVIEFCSTLTVYCLEDENENEVYDFDITNFLNNL